jgi:hypothetical protein
LSSTCPDTLLPRKSFQHPPGMRVGGSKNSPDNMDK